MPKTLHFDCFAGISGDMTLGALVDLGVDPEDLRRELEKLGLSGWALEFRRDERGGISGLHAEVILDGRTDHIAHDDEVHGHAEDHEHHHHHDDEHGHEHEHGQDHHHGHDGHQHNTWKEIRGLIEKAPLRPGAKGRALEIFGRIAAAEAQVHGKPVEEVAFHEVGAMDSIIDIVGSAICLDLLAPDRITCGEVELGGGTVRCAHGILPVPAPATALLVRGMPVKTGGFNKEMTTPTGAAILAASVDEFITGPLSFRELKTGHGIGTRRMDRPNFLRISLRENPASLRDAPVSLRETPGSPGENPVSFREVSAPLREAAAGQDWNAEELILMEANIDDMTGEALGFLMESLFEAGALDVTFSPCVMKKSRPATLVSTLAPPAKLDALRRTLFTRSSTIGFRETVVRRLSLKRETQTLKGPFGEARRKMVYLGDKALRGKIEYEDRAALARERSISLDEAERIIAAGEDRG
jgi:uncharacterized protein (TIGR00299 family) protein